METVKINKKNKAEELIRRDQIKFRCPVCSGPMKLNRNGSLVCSGKHSFDLARTGYINLLASKTNEVYSKDLFEARRSVCTKGFFDPLTDTIGNLIREYCKSTNFNYPAVLDAGCGEGSHLSSLSGQLKDGLKCGLFGIDIAKEGILIASKNDPDIVWAVADLARLPFQQSSFHVILNILSPANYHEFARVLTDNGIIVKVVPGKDYLKELRELIYKDNHYSGDRVADYFSSQLEVVSRQDIRYQFQLDEEILPDLLEMTPLTWGGNAEELKRVNTQELSSITVDLTILIGRKTGDTDWKRNKQE